MKKFKDFRENVTFAGHNSYVGASDTDNPLDEKLVDRMYVTVVKEKFDGDTFFPKISSEWKEIERIDCKSDNEHAYDYSFLVYEKNI